MSKLCLNPKVNIKNIKKGIAKQKTIMYNTKSNHA